MDKPKYRTMTEQEVADFLKVSTRTVKRRVAEGTIPAPRQIGRLKRWDEQEFYAWWDSKKKDAKIWY